jgi:hypothetical protein
VRPIEPREARAAAHKLEHLARLVLEEQGLAERQSTDRRASERPGATERGRAFGKGALYRVLDV